MKSIFRNLMSLPNAYIIGVQKAGTTSLHNWLAQHPDIYAPLEFKDVDYFANPAIAADAKERLEEDFASYNGEKVILQSQVNYILYPKALDRIKALTPQARLIVILRDPVDRAMSAYRYFKKMGNENRDAEEALLYKPKKKISYSKENSDFTYIEHGMYGRQLEAVYQKFNPEHILVLQFEELISQPQQLTSKVFNFLAVTQSFTPSFDKRNKTGKARFKWIQNRLTSTSWLRQLIIKYLFSWWLSVEKRQFLRKQLIELNTGEKKRKSTSKELKEQLQPLFMDDQKKLKEILETHG